MASSQAGEPAWMAEARALIGLKEIVGSKHEPRIVKFFADAGHPWVKDDETAWCAAFVNAMLKRVGIEGTGSLAARSFLDWGEKLDKPRVGCIVVFSRGNPKGWQGHVGFYVGEDKTYVHVLGGNQSNAVNISRYSKARLLGYRWPKQTAKAADLPKIVGKTEIERLQTALKELGYHEVGMIDGLWGPRTRAALLAFKADNGLPLNDSVDEAVWAAIPKAKPRPVSPERAMAKEAPSEAAKAASAAKKVGATVAAVGAAETALQPVGGIGGLVDQIGSVVGVLRAITDPLKDLAGLAAENWMVAAILVGVGLYFLGRHIFKDEIESFRNGEWS